MKKIRTLHKGRICKFPHCKHVLSIYNHEAYCHIHLNLVDGMDKQIKEKQNEQL